MRRTDILAQAQAIRAATQVLGRTAEDGVALSCPALFDQWDGGGVQYVAGDVRRQGGELYRCLQAHTSQDDWQPGVAASLWVKIANPAEEWPEWVQPAGAVDAYEKGAKVTHNGTHWVSTVTANTWEPGVYGWTEYTE